MQFDFEDDYNFEDENEEIKDNNCVSQFIKKNSKQNKNKKKQTKFKTEQKKYR